MDKLNLPGEEMRAAFEMDQGCAWGQPENRREEGLWAKAWRLATNRAEALGDLMTIISKKG